MIEQRDTLRGFSAPLSPDGNTSLYGPPPWRFAGRSLTVIAECDPAAINALIPAPLSAADGPPYVRFSIHRLICDLGFGWTFAQSHPERSQFHEAVVGIAVCHEGENGYWDPFLWCDGDAETAVGREMYGWPQRMADLSVTEPNPLTGWRVGDLATGKISRFHDPVMSLSVSIDREGDLSLELPRFSIFYTERVLPDPASGVITRELFASTMAEVAVADQFSGTATLTLQAPELQALQPKRVVGGKINTVAWTKGSARHVANREHAGSNPC